jgi:hypothetical protein
LYRFFAAQVPLAAVPHLPHLPGARATLVWSKEHPTFSIPPAHGAGFLSRSSLPLIALLALSACWRIGEPTEYPARITWAAYPDTVVIGSVFSFELAGPVSPDACGRLDTVMVEVRDSVLILSGTRSVYDTMCADSRVSFYEARPLRIPAAGRWAVRTVEGRDLGSLVAIDSGAFSPMRAVGEGTLHAVEGCLLFGPGWIGNQRPFALRGDTTGLGQHAGTDRRVRIDGHLAGFTTCGAWGSRPVIRADRHFVTDSTGAQYFEE